MRLVALIVIPVAFLLATTNAQNEIRVGYAYPFNDPDQIPAMSIELWASQACSAGGQHVSLTLEQVNSTGGIDINGTAFFVKTFPYDDDLNCVNDLVLYERMIIHDHVHLLFAPPSACPDSATIAEAYGIPMLNAESAALAWVYTQNHTYTFTLFPRITGVTGSCMAAVVEKGARTAVMTYAPFDETAGLLPVQLISNAQYNITVTSNDILDPNILSASISDAEFNAYLDPLIAKWALLKPDIFIWSGDRDVAQGLRFLARIRAARFEPPAILVWNGPNLEQFRQGAGWMASGLLSVSGWDATENFTDPVFGSSQGYVAAYERAYNATPDTYSAVITLAGVIAGEAIRIAGSLDPDAIRDAVRNYNATTLYGPTWFNTENLFGEDDPCWQLRQDGRYLPVYPHTFPTAVEISYPATVVYPPPPPPAPPNYALLVGLPVGLVLGLLVCGALSVALFHVVRRKYALVFIAKGQVGRDDDGEGTVSRWPAARPAEIKHGALAGGSDAKLNVGGRPLAFSAPLLRKLARGDDGAVFLDRDGDLFVRTGRLGTSDPATREHLLAEAEWWRLEEVSAAVTSHTEEPDSQENGTDT